MQRRELFSGFAKSFRKKEKNLAVIRPPYYEDEDAFYKECIACEGSCANVCKEHIIVIEEDKTPRLDFTKGGCTYCDACALACEFGVLEVAHKKEVAARFEIDMLQCLSWNQTMCFSCKDPCLDKAIDFIAMFRPVIDSSKCTGCGFCVGVCPTDAVKVIPNKEEI